MLALAEGCEPGLVAALLDPAAEPLDLLRDPPPSLPPRVHRRLVDPNLRQQALALLERAKALDLLVLTPTDPRYPERLRTVALRPNALFVRGDPAALAHAPAIAVVGSRTPTPYGTAAAHAFAGALAQAGTSIWSGLARGIDGIAHRQCLANGQPTIAVLAGGLDSIYPGEHRDLAAAIVAGGGCLLSELPPGRRAQRGHFPRRNRILAATRAVLVVEAGRCSGALPTARFCADQGCTVWALPGPWTSERSQGCHRLLQEGALVATDPAELLRDLGLGAPLAPAIAHALQASGDAAALLACLQQGPRPADLVQRESGLPRPQFLQARLQLELAGHLLTLPGDLLARAQPAAPPVNR